MLKRVLRLAVIALAVIAVLIIAGGWYARSRVQASLPQLTGTATVAGLAADVTVERDALGVPTISAGSREDVARALGFLHAQDRFFQMDLQRRQPAGELSGLVGPRAMEVDEAMRVHRLRDVAHRALALAEPSYRRILDAYTEGVNAGLAALGAAPFEYLVLRATPEPWIAEDSILTVLAMFNTLQGKQADFERTFGAMRDTLPPAMFRFLASAGSEWDTPVVGQGTLRPPTPGAEVFDLRRQGVALSERTALLRGARVEGLLDPDEWSTIGSNNWAVDGAHSASGAAILANDMHLTIAVPIIWYRASMQFPDPGEPSRKERITGVTLPGLPGMVVGSNGHVAWGFTNTGGDWSDLVRIDPDPRDAAKYLTPDGPKAFDVYRETIAAKGGPAKDITVRWTMWGPIVWKDARGREYAQRWIAHDAEALASDITKPERARSVDDMRHAIAGLGIPNQNVTMADTTGRIGWTIGGAIPRRVGHDGLTPESWADGTNDWHGYLSPAEFPHIVDPPEGRIWTANAPVVDGAMLAAIGEGGYADGIRARLIRDRLLDLRKATPQDMLSIQLEDRALFLERWRKLLLDALDKKSVGPRAQFRDLVDKTWTGRASPGSVAYRLVKEFRLALVTQVMTSLTAPARAVDPAFDYTRSLRGEGPVWQILAERPPHLLDPKFTSWDAAILSAVDTAIARLTEGGRTLDARTWGEANTAQILHPLAAAIPLIGPRLNMPAEPLPGDVYTPRASTPRTGPSERMAVSPGREEEGILHIPTGQSGHPLSPHYGDQYRAWLLGEPTPFLPGPTVTTLILKGTPMNDINRRDFLKLSGAAALAPSAPSHQAPPYAPHAPYAPYAPDSQPIETVRIGMVGIGLQGGSHVENFLKIPGCRITAVCDIREERTRWAQEAIVKAGHPSPVAYSRGPRDFERLCETEDLDLVFTATPWEWHVPVMLAAMKAGKHAATEVPAAMTLDDCWALVEAAEKYRRHAVMMENCNYDRPEMMVLNIVQRGLLGEVLHAEGGYLHDLREIKFEKKDEGLWRRAWSRKLDGNPYPTHGLGPIANCLDINRGDRFDYLVSMSGPSRGLQDWAREHYPADAPERQERFTLGDVNTSLIKTARGRTVMVQHCTNLPRPYSRIQVVQGTKGMFQGYPNRLYIEGRGKPHQWVDAATVRAEFDHPLWVEIEARAAGAGHGGMDYIEDYRLIQCLREGRPTDMNVYDAAALSAVVDLSVRSTQQKSRAVEFPDFTRGAWRTNPRLTISGELMA